MKKLILVGALLLPAMLFAQDTHTTSSADQLEDGERIEWYENGQMSTYNKGGHSIEFDRNGQKRYENIFTDGTRDGLSTAWREGQMLEQKSLLNGELHGLRSTWDKNGDVYQECYYYGQSINEGPCPDLDAIEGVPDGIPQISVDKTKKRMGAIFKIGEGEAFSGVVTDHDASGQIISEIFLLDGRPNGPARSWYNNGQKKSESIFGNGRPNGTVLTWHENGQMRSQQTYLHGKLSKEKYWTESGSDPSLSFGAKEALSLMGGAKAAVRRYFYDRLEFPSDNASAGMSEASEITGKYVTSIAIDSGIITATIETSSDSGADQRTLIFTPSVDESGSSILWQCHSPDIENASLPPPCK